MNSLNYISDIIESMKAQGASKEAIIKAIGPACEGWPYVFGAWGEQCTPAGRKKRARDKYPTIVTKCQVLNGSESSCAGCKWDLPVRMFDCRGFTYWILQQVGIKINGQGCTSQYNDKTNWVVRGDIKDMPRDKVCIIFTGTAKTKEHTGVYLGDGSTVECSSGVQFFKTMKTKWKYYAIPVGLYDETPQPAPQPEPTPQPAKHTTLRKGARGEEVLEMQRKLLKHGEALPRFGADSIFGNETMAAVKNFQLTKGLVVDGICGPRTWAALDKE